MRVLFITGSSPPEICGVGDYTDKLATSLVQKGLCVEVLSRGKLTKYNKSFLNISQINNKWRGKDLLEIMAVIKKFSPELIHIQYPSIGFGNSLVPQLVSSIYRLFLIPIITTIHEFKIAHILRKMSILIFIYTSQKVIFTTNEEKNYVIKFVKNCRKATKKFEVIPIGSNLPNLESQNFYDSNLVIFWGMFHKGKNIEVLLKGFQIAKMRNPNLRLLLIGGKHPRYSNFINEIEYYIKDLGLDKSVDFMINQPPNIIAHCLQKSCVAVLPFSDGVTFRRGTFIAAAQLGVPVITCKGEDTPKELLNNHNIIFADNYVEIASAILSITSDMNKRKNLSKNIKALMNEFNWDSIAEKHIKIYEDTVKYYYDYVLKI
ncbi:MAG: glycosyltransferase family 4 protein [candidate division WOR-3 bacterium]